MLDPPDGGGEDRDCAAHGTGAQPLRSIDPQNPRREQPSHSGAADTGPMPATVASSPCPAEGETQPVGGGALPDVAMDAAQIPIPPTPPPSPRREVDRSRVLRAAGPALPPEAVNEALARSCETAME
eukprot:6055829-Pyramimonas_sp.AAC.1